jgi:hypothetical protein
MLVKRQVAKKPRARRRGPQRTLDFEGSTRLELGVIHGTTTSIDRVIQAWVRGGRRGYVVGGGQRVGIMGREEIVA